MKASHYYITALFAASGHTGPRITCYLLKPFPGSHFLPGEAQAIRASGGPLTKTPSPPTICPAVQEHPGEGNGTPLQYSCLENPMDGGAWWAAVRGVAKSRT